MHALGIATAVFAAPSAVAQTAPAAPAAAAPDSARLAAAEALIERVMPAGRIEALVDQTIRPMMGNLRQAMQQAPQMQAVLAKDPKASAQINSFVDGEMARSMMLVKQSMPAVHEAVKRAYARRFTVAQMNEIRAFFETPTGRVYAEQAPTIMNDPDVLAAQRTMMMKALEGLQQRAQALAAKLAAEQDKK